MNEYKIVLISFFSAGSCCAITNPFQIFELSPFDTPETLQERYKQVSDKLIEAEKSTEGRKKIRAELGSASKQLQTPEKWRESIYYLLVNTAEERTPRFGLDPQTARLVADYMLDARNFLHPESVFLPLSAYRKFIEIVIAPMPTGTEITEKTLRYIANPESSIKLGPPNIIDSNSTIARDYTIKLQQLNKNKNITEEERTILRQKIIEAYIILTKPWRLKDVLKDEVIKGMEIYVKDDEVAEQKSQKELAEKQKQEELKNKQEEDERQRKKQENERLKQEELRKQEELQKQQEQEATERKKREDIQAQKSAEERRLQEEDALARGQEAQQERSPWKNTLLTFSTSSTAPAASAHKFTFELKNKTNQELTFDIIKRNNVASENLPDQYNDEKAIRASKGPDEKDHGYVRIAGLDPESAYTIQVSLVIDAAGKRRRFLYDIGSNQNRKRILLTFESRNNRFELRPQKGAFLSSLSQSGIPLEGNVSSSEIELRKN